MLFTIQRRRSGKRNKKRDGRECRVPQIRQPCASSTAAVLSILQQSLLQGTRVCHRQPYCLLYTNIQAVRKSVIQPNTATDCLLHHVSTSCGQLYGLTKGITAVLHRTVQLALVPTTCIILIDHTNQFTQH